MWCPNQGTSIVEIIINKGLNNLYAFQMNGKGRTIGAYSKGYTGVMPLHKIQQPALLPSGRGSATWLRGIPYSDAVTLLQGPATNWLRRAITIAPLPSPTFDLHIPWPLHHNHFPPFPLTVMSPGIGSP